MNLLRHSRNNNSNRLKNNNNNLLSSLILAISLLGLYWFASSFFLAKRSLPLYSSCDEAATLLLKTLGLDSSTISKLQDYHVIPKENENNTTTTRNGCWMDRRVESLTLIVVDALRFDFCLYHLPRSVGQRLHSDNNKNHSRLFRFIADPPTVTMQRLKALTTGGLPTFADISANFGGAGAKMDDDNWLYQLKSSDANKRGLYGRKPNLGFVGDDTWLDLYPNSFSQKASFPYPSFNTRDLDTVDNGCLKHLPHLLKQQQQTHEGDDFLEVVVVHFLGVDHVGHTYGPNTQAMDVKLNQIDDALAEVLDQLEYDQKSCRAALILGDHGMTPDGNHGGGTLEEVSAALFVHTSKGCGDMAQASDLELENSASSFAFGNLRAAAAETSSSSSSFSSTSTIATPVFASIHQIDLVPTLSFLLGIPIPFANLGSLVPSLLPRQSSSSSVKDGLQTATALALNAAQVWRYLTTYSKTANALPQVGMDRLERQLEAAVDAFQLAVNLLPLASSTDKEEKVEHGMENFYQLVEQACKLWKHFLTQALELGQRVWTRFDMVGMMGGMALQGAAILAYVFVVAVNSSTAADARRIKSSSSERVNDDDQQQQQPQPPSFSSSRKHEQNGQTNLPPVAVDGYSFWWWETGLAVLFMFYQCGLLTFSNSYILEEQHSLMYSLAVLSLSVALRLLQHHQHQRPEQQQPTRIWKSSSHLWLRVLLIPLASRIGELVVSGHGLDPSIRLHVAHSAAVFWASIGLLVAFRWYLCYYQQQQRIILLEASSPGHALADCVALVCLGASWWEKRNVDPNRHGFVPCRIALGLLGLGVLVSLYQQAVETTTTSSMMTEQSTSMTSRSIKSKSSHGLLLLCKFLIAIMAVTGPSAASTLVLYSVQLSVLCELNPRVPAVVMTALIKLVTRRVFFATNHGCAFNRLQYSAAFAATTEFYFVTGGISLFLNTFGWEMAGLAFCWLLSCRGRTCHGGQLKSPSSSDTRRTTTTSTSAGSLWHIYVTCQLLEALTSCISVTLLRRHLMVWDIYAPHFLFASIFTVLAGLSHMTLTLLEALHFQ